MTSPPIHPVLFVDDEVDLIDTFRNNFDGDFSLLMATSGPAALELLRAHDVAVMVTDQRMPDMHGLEVIRQGLGIRPHLIPIILTGFTNDADLIEAINLQRIYRYIPKPWNRGELRHTIEGALEKFRLVRENERLTSDLQQANERLRAENAYLRSEERPRLLVGESAPVRRLVDEIRRAAPKDVTVLIEGETGTGKELVARSIHAGSPRRDRLFVAVNCAELTQDAAESRLFGHRRGSFTGATDDHKGFFEVADGGTLFLDEIGELPLPLQSKLLRVLQDGEIMRFGDNKARKVDVRVVAATNRQLDDEARAGRFRSDLLYRLKVIPLRVPSLRERRDDILPLAEHFLSLHSRKMRMPPPHLTPEARRALTEHEFPGNVRDLENTLIRALVMADDPALIRLGDLPDLASTSVVVDAGGEETTRAANADADDRSEEGLLASVDRFEREQIEKAIAAADGNRAAAARALKISYRWLLKKLERYGTLPSEPLP